MQNLYEWGISIVLMVQGLGEWMLTPMNLISFLGSAEFYLLIMPILYWSIDAALGLRIGVILLSSDVLSYYIKIGFHTARPFWFSRQVESHAFEYSFGLTSSHAQNSAAVFGLIAATLKRWWVWVLCLILIFLIGLSRMYLAVHFPQDVLLGWAVGFLLVWLFIRFEEPIAAWFTGTSLPVSILALFIISLLMLFVGLLLRSLFAGWQIPAEWVENARLAFPDEETINPFGFSGLLTSSAIFFGLSGGALWISKRGGFSAQGEWWRRILRFIVGVVGVAILYFVLEPLLPEDPLLLASVLGYILYALIGVWISALAPMIFLAIKLAEPKS